MGPYSTCLHQLLQGLSVLVADMENGGYGLDVVDVLWGWTAAYAEVCPLVADSGHIVVLLDDDKSLYPHLLESE